MKKLRKQNGITLVALVITIVILLILAGISISALTNQGLFGKANEAKQATENAEKEESEILENYLAQMNEYNTEKVEEIFKNVNKTNTNPEGAMPKGAVVIEGDANKGIVIKDSNDNEWTWVEVPKNITEGKTTDAEIETALQTYAGDYREGKTGQGLNWTDEWYAMDENNLVTASTANLTTEQKSLKNGCGLTYDEYNTAKSKMLQSIKTNGGFWISRYEAGIEGTNIDTTSNEIPNVRFKHSNITNDSPKAVSQANRIPYYYVYCSEAQMLASAMSTDSSKTSSLLFGIQWDLTCKFLETKTKLKTEDIKTDSTSWGNYYNNSIKLIKGKYNTSPYSSNSKWLNITSGAKSAQLLLTTGASEETNKMNIYDFAGNELEWTLEKTSNASSPCASRGGGFGSDGSYCPVAYRSNNSTFESDYYYGFRSTLY